MKKISLITAVIIAGIIIGGRMVMADSAALFISPIFIKSTVGETISAAVQLNPVKNKVCVVKGTVNLKNLACQGITVASGLVAQTTPSCAKPSFSVGIPNCSTNVQNILNLSVSGILAGQGSLFFTDVEVIGKGVAVPSTTQSGVYTIGEVSATAPAIIPVPTYKPTTSGVKLFDIVLSVQSAVLNKASDLVAGAWFTNFGTVTTPVDLVYRIENSAGKEVYTEKGTVTVETEQMVTKDFTNLTLDNGKYTLVLSTTYGDNVQDEFRQAFEVKGATVSSQGMAWWVWMVAALAIIGIGGGLMCWLIKRKKKAILPQ